MQIDVYNCKKLLIKFTKVKMLEGHMKLGKPVWLISKPTKRYFRLCKLKTTLEFTEII